MGLTKIFRIQLRFIIMNYKMIYQYPSIIIGGFIESLALIGSFFVFWNVILLEKSFGSWSLEEIMVFFTINYFCWGLASFFFTGVWEIPLKIINGNIERWLCRPLRHPLLGILFEDVWVGGGAYLVVSIGLLAGLTSYYHFQYQLMNVILAIIVLLLGMSCLYLMYGAMVVLSAWLLGRAEFVGEFFNAIESSFTKIPITTLPNPLKMFLIFGYPVAFISTFPAEILLGKMTVEDSLLLLVILSILLIIWFELFLFIWNTGIKHYESVSN